MSKNSNNRLVRQFGKLISKSRSLGRTRLRSDESQERLMKYTLRPDLKACGNQIHSQTDEDGIIEAIFEDIPPRSRFFVEFGIGPNWLDPTYEKGIEGNCVLLREKGWTGLFMDGGEHPEHYDIKREFITAMNINGLLRKYGTPEHVDIVSIDVDGQDFWIWMALDYRPTLIICEYNPNFFNAHDSVTVAYDPNFRWDTTKYYGASLGALVKLAADKDYKLVYANGVNGFFVRRDMLANPDDFDEKQLLVSLDQHGYDHFRRAWVSI
jgi:hypothetical protein